MARASRAPITALYVDAADQRQARLAAPRADGILKDIVALADSYNVEAKTAVRAEKLRRPGHPQGDGRSASTT